MTTHARAFPIHPTAGQEGLSGGGSVTKCGPAVSRVLRGIRACKGEGREPATPIELQLQWRLSYRKTYVGSEALLRRRQEGPRQRLTCLVADRPLEVGSSVLLRGSVVGRIVNACYSPIREDWVALALLDVAWAHPGIGAFRAEAGGEHVPMRSLSPPLLNNRSLHVNPQVHSYRTRGEFEFPPLPRG